MTEIQESLMRHYARTIIRSHVRDIEYHIDRQWLEEEEGRKLTEEEWLRVKYLLDNAMVTIYFPGDLDEITKHL